MSTDIPPLDLATRPHRRRRWWLLLPLAALAAWGVLRLYGGGNDGNGGVHYTTAPLERGELVVRVTATGTLEPLNQVEVGSELSGTVRSVAVDFNQQVRSGELLARLDTETLEARVVQARAALEVAEAGVAEAGATAQETRLRFQRCERLAKRQLCSEEELETTRAAQRRAEAQQASARAQVAVARATLAADETNLRKATILAPIDGIVLDRQVEPGQTVAASLQTPVLFVLAEDLKKMELHVDVDEADIGQVAAGQPATFTVDAYPEHSFPAVIREVRFAPETVEGVVTYRAVLLVDNDELLLRPGMTATAEIEVQRLESALLAPNAALRFQPPAPKAAAGNRGALGWLFKRPPRGGGRAPAGDGKRVWVLRDGQPAPLAVKAGPSDGRRTALHGEGLEPGLEVIVAGEMARP